MPGLIPMDDVRRLQKRMNRLMEDVSSELETRYPEEMRAIQDRMNRLMEDFEDTFEKEVPPGTAVPMADVMETDEALVVVMDLPGMDKKDVEISISEDELTVKAVREEEEEKEKERYYSRERTFAYFERKVKLPVEVKAEEAKAKLKDGVLEVTLPKEIVTTRRQITIE